MLLPLANILHYKLRSVLSAAGIAIGVCLLLVLTGLTRGSLNEAAERWEAVDAELMLAPPTLGHDVTSISGIGVPDRLGKLVRREHGERIRRITPVFLYAMDMAGQSHLAAGVDADALGVLTGGRLPAKGRIFAPKIGWDALLDRIEARQSPDADGERPPLEVTEQDLKEAGYLELVIDHRLAAAGNYRLGQTVRVHDHTWTLVGIVPAGGITRVYMPRRTAQFLFGSAAANMSSLMFVKLAEGVDPVAAAREMRSPRYEMLPISQFRAMLDERFALMHRVSAAVNVIAMVIAFLFIMNTLYMMVLQRTREIAILKSSGASNAFILRQVLGESMILTATGLVAGIALAYLAGWGIESLPALLTVTITPELVVTAGVLALAGGAAAALYPAWRAIRVDMVEALTLE